MTTQQPSAGMPWVNVTVYQPPKGPVIVNVYGFESYGKARTGQRNVNKTASAILAERGGVLIANRVRPVLAFDKDGTLIEPEDIS
jgi:hypothetical protein